MTQLNHAKQTNKERGRRGIPLDRDEFKPRTYLYVPFTEKEQAKALGAKWDKAGKQWYCLGNSKKFKQWEKFKCKTNKN